MIDEVIWGAMMGKSKSGLIEVDFQAVFDLSRDAAFVFDKHGHILDANQVAVSRYGYSAQELKQLNASDLAPVELKKNASSKLDQALKSGEVFEWRHRCKDGSELPVEIFTQPITVHGEQAILSRVRDISLRKKIESELQNKNHFLERILDTEPGTVYIFDLLTQQNIYINQYWLGTYGYSIEEIQGIGVDLNTIFHPDDMSEISTHHQAWLNASDEESRIIEYRIRDKQGNWHWLSSHEKAFSRGTDGRVSQILGIACDITERKQAEILLGGQNKVLEMIAAGVALPETLNALILFIEQQSPGMLGSVLLLDADGVHIRHGAAPSLPEAFVRAINVLPLGPVVGSCGTAAFRKEAVFVEDIKTDPLWVDYKTVALTHGLRACWSTPIFDAHGAVLGTFAMYYTQPGLPQAEHVRLINTATHVAAIAISHHRDETALRESEARLAKAEQVAHVGNWSLEVADGSIKWSDELWRIFGRTPGSVKLDYATILSWVRNDFRSYHNDLRARMQSLRPGDTIDHSSYCLVRPDGKERWVEGLLEATYDQSGKPVRFFGTVQDITERTDAEARVHRLTQLYAALSQCNQAIVRCNNKEELFPSICRDAVNFGGMKMAWIGMLDETGQLVMPVASFGTGVEYLDGLEISVDINKQSGQGPTGSAVRDQLPYWCQDFLNDPATAHWHERAAKFGWGASASLPLMCNGVVVGAFSLYTEVVNAFDESAQTLLIKMMTDISYALDRFASETQRKQAVEALQKSEQHLRTIIETEPECVKVVDRRGMLLEMNEAGLAMLEADSLEQVKTRPLLDYILPPYQNAFRELHVRVMKGENAALEFEVQGLKGTRRWLATSAAPLRDENGKITTLLGITRDITSRKLAEERVNYLANFDVLTGLPNRAQLDAHLKYALSIAKRSNGQMAVMFIDIDRFKDINDTLGHSIGDAILVEVAKRLQLVLREQDIASRLGGDEFMLILPGSEAWGVAQVAQKLLNTLSQPYRSEHYDLTVTASIGIALYPTDGVDLEALSKSADTAMYQAKREGRNGYRFFTAEMQESATRNMKLISALRLALIRDQFCVHYQPQISLHSGQMVGAEALLRWKHPELGDVTPAEFIPVAEDSGLILAIGEWVLRTAVQQLKSWLDKGHKPIVIAVNLSVVQFRHPNFIEMVTRILEEEQLPHEYLELELTEGVAMNDPQGAIAVMNSLHERGIRMSIDDFGTGYSSLNYLKKFKVYKLKIDQSFVRDIIVDPEDKAIVAAIINMSKSLGLQTIAEGVETKAQLDLLTEQGCDEVQGYYYSKPLPAEQFEAQFGGVR